MESLELLIEDDPPRLLRESGPEGSLQGQGASEALSRAVPGRVWRVKEPCGGGSVGRGRGSSWPRVRLPLERPESAGGERVGGEK